MIGGNGRRDVGGPGATRRDRRVKISDQLRQAGIIPAEDPAGDSCGTTERELARLDERIGGFLNGRHTGIRRTYHGRAQEVRSQHSTAGADRKQ